MLTALISKLNIFGTANERAVNRYLKTVGRINEFEPACTELTDAELAAKTTDFKARHALGQPLDDMLPEAFAVVREAAKRVMGQRPYDVQLLGGMVLHDGKIAEMRTGEGKTLMSALPAYLNALAGKGVHVVTVNDYLAQRDADVLGPLYQFLGLSVGVNLAQMAPQDKALAYAADITYGTNNEFGFDYLRDNMATHIEGRAQRPMAFAIIDEVDSILIDEARTPLIITGQAEDDVSVYALADQIPAKLTRQESEDSEEGGDYLLNEKEQQVTLTDAGHEKVEGLLREMGLLAVGGNLYDTANIGLLHHTYAALRAHTLFFRDQHYVVQNGEVVLVDEFTGRLMSGRRWSEGLHQAVEAKEGVAIQKENKTLASISLQNYFRLYPKLAGMTGTADTEAFEFQFVYGLETLVIPTHRPIARVDEQDLVFRTSAERDQAVIADIRACHERGQPVLVGTTSIESNEKLAAALTAAGLPHNMLNAKQHGREAEIVAQAGLPGAITLATNMAGRGTDIKLGGSLEHALETIEGDETLSDEARAERLAAANPEWAQRHGAVTAAGGLRIVGTERHESRRVDNQLRGRAGRQGDPGSSQFFLSLEDPLLRVFAGDHVARLMDMLDVPEGEALENKFASRAVESAQHRVEQRNFDIRKDLLGYDDVANEQRQVIYSLRNDLLGDASGQDRKQLANMIQRLQHNAIDALVAEFLPAGSMMESWDIPGLQAAALERFDLKVPVAQWLLDDNMLDEAGVTELVKTVVDRNYGEQEALAGPLNMRGFESAMMLQSIDTHWREHLEALDHLRQGINLRSYGNKDPKQEYKREAFAMFEAMLESVYAKVARNTLTVRVGPRMPEAAGA
jgi:preprotein translocase subunit SecA